MQGKKTLTALIMLVTAALEPSLAVEKGDSAGRADFDVVDDDVLSARLTCVEDGALVAGAMRYRTIVVGPTKWITQVAQDRLKALEAAGGQVIRIADLSRIDAALAEIPPTISLGRWATTLGLGEKS